MNRARGKVEVEDLTPGTGAAATREHKVRLSYRIMLHHGDCVQNSDNYSTPPWIDLKRRDCIAGLRYGVEGMRVGGRRRIKVPPHLAYGAIGVPGLIPPNAMLICEVELLELKPTHPIKPKLKLARERKVRRQA